jgi:Mn2+/Fe2+ NRAMP family transporter
VQTADEAASALAPVAGPYARAIFALGLLGSALIAIPVLAGTSAYVAAEMFGWRGSLDRTFGRAKRFYTVLIGSLVVALAICAAGVPPISLLFLSSIAGGIATPITLILMLMVARSRRVMGHHMIGVPLTIAGWTVAAVVVAATVAYFVQTATGGGG